MKAQAAAHRTNCMLRAMPRNECVFHFASLMKYAVALWDGPPLNDRRYHDGGLEEEKTNGESEN